MEYPKARPEDIERLRRAIGCRSLGIEFDPMTAEEIGKQAWNIFYVEQGQPTWICDWRGSLDGNVEGVVLKVAKYDYARMKGVRAYANALEDKIAKHKKSKDNRRLDTWRGLADYSRKCFQALADGKPNVGAT